MRSVKYSNASPRTLYSTMHKKSESFVQPMHQAFDVLNTTGDLNLSINEYPIQKPTDIERLWDEHLKRLIQNTKAEMQDLYMIDTDVEFTSGANTYKSNKYNKTEHSMNNNMRSMNKSSWLLGTQNNKDKMKKRKHNYMNYAVNR